MVHEYFCDSVLKLKSESRLNFFIQEYLLYWILLNRVTSCDSTSRGEELNIHGTEFYIFKIEKTELPYWLMLSIRDYIMITSRIHYFWCTFPA